MNRVVSAAGIKDLQVFLKWLLLNQMRKKDQEIPWAAGILESAFAPLQ